jgi:hypothetical protein
MKNQYIIISIIIIILTSYAAVNITIYFNNYNNKIIAEYKNNQNNINDINNKYVSIEKSDYLYLTLGIVLLIFLLFRFSNYITDNQSIKLKEYIILIIIISIVTYYMLIHTNYRFIKILDDNIKKENIEIIEIIKKNSI